MSGDIDWCADPDNYWLIRYVFGDEPNFVMYARFGDDEARCVWYIPSSPPQSLITRAKHDVVERTKQQ